jgi:hypothetical protein
MFPNLEAAVSPLLICCDYGSGRGSVFGNEIADLDSVV